MKKNYIVSGLFVLGMALAVSNESVAYYNNDDRAERTIRGGLLGGVTGAAIGGIAGGGTGAIVGGGIGLAGGSIFGASTSPRDPQYKLDRLHSKRDSLTRRQSNAKSERKRARIQKSIDRVNADIRSYQVSYGMSSGMGGGNL